jgi:hypothetical protein
VRSATFYENYISSARINEEVPILGTIEQLHLLIGYLGNGHLSVTENWTVPQWQDAWCVVRSASEVGSTIVRSVISSGLGSLMTDIIK